MKQHEAVVQTLETLGGQATLADLYTEVMKMKDCKWGTKTPFASIRRIVQTRPEIFKVRPGLWALRSHKKRLGLNEHPSRYAAVARQNHSYYQGLLVIIGNLRGLRTFIPNQDKNKLFVNKTLGQLRTLQDIPQFTHEILVRKSRTVDVIWFNDRQMPNSLFEVEHASNMENSLLKFYELRDFSARMVIVADENRQREFSQRIHYGAFDEIKDRVNFLGYNTVVKQYEFESYKASQLFIA